MKRRKSGSLHFRPNYRDLLSIGLAQVLRLRIRFWEKDGLRNSLRNEYIRTESFGSPGLGLNYDSLGVWCHRVLRLLVSRYALSKQRDDRFGRLVLPRSLKFSKHPWVCFFHSMIETTLRVQTGSGILRNSILKSRGPLGIRVKLVEFAAFSTHF